VFRLNKTVAVVTGSASGIGAATAELFAAAGADVVCGWYRGDPHDVNATLKRVQENGRRAVSVEADVRSDGDTSRLIDAAIENFGRVDVVVANAAIARLVPSHELDDERWNDLLDIDLTGVFRCFRAAIPHMVREGRGRLLATTSTAGAVHGWPEHAHYTAAKSGIIGIVRALAVELGPHGITVNAVAPGVIETPQSADPVNSMGPDGLRNFPGRVPMRRNGAPRDIAAAFVFLASEEAGYMTGQTLIVDGGLSIQRG
jgi:3-oxoacyl-[acyl-carrier protein] reductase